MTKDEVIARLAFKVEEMENKLNKIRDIVDADWADVDESWPLRNAIIAVSNIISFRTDIDDL